MSVSALLQLYVPGCVFMCEQRILYACVFLSVQFCLLKFHVINKYKDLFSLRSEPNISNVSCLLISSKVLSAITTVANHNTRRPQMMRFHNPA